MIDEQKARKLEALEEIRRMREENRKKDAEERRSNLIKKAKERDQAIRDRHDRNIEGNRRRRGAIGVFWTSRGITKLHPYSTRAMIVRWMREHLAEGQSIDIDELHKKCSPFLYGAKIRQHLVRLEEFGHIEYVFKT